MTILILSITAAPSTASVAGATSAAPEAPAAAAPVPAPTVTTTVMATPSSAPGAVTTAGTTSMVSPLLSAAVIAALVAAAVTGAVNLWLARRRSLEEERARVRTTLAEAFAAYTEYKEFPYAIRRRRHDEPETERARLSEALRVIQARLSYYQAWTAAEAPTVGARYAELLTDLRRIAGTAMHDAWLAEPVTTDGAMNISPGVVDLSALQPRENAYTTAVQDHLRDLTTWTHVWRRW